MSVVSPVPAPKLPAVDHVAGKPISSVQITALTPEGEVAVQSLASVDTKIFMPSKTTFNHSAANEIYPSDLRKFLVAGDQDGADTVFPKHSTDFMADVPANDPKFTKTTGVFSALAAVGLLSADKIVGDGSGWQKPDTIVLSVSNMTPENVLAVDTRYRWNLSDLNPEQKSAVDVARLAVSELTKDSKNSATLVNKAALAAANAAMTAVMKKMDEPGANPFGMPAGSGDGENPFGAPPSA